MNSSQLFGITTIAYLLSSVCYIGLFVFRNKKVGQVGLGLAVLGILAQTVGLGLRWQESYTLGIGHAPLTNMYESLLFFAWCAAIFYVLLEIKFKLPVIGAFAMPIPFITLAYTSVDKGLSRDISPLVPALQSNWLIAHVITCFIGYGAFAVAAGLGIMYLLKQFGHDRKFSADTLIGSLPELRTLDDVIHKTIVFGFMWLSAGIITGAVWANEAWGTYWSWDPKETWSIITWFVYALTLHARFTRGWNGSRIAWLAIIGFISVFFTYFGVNYLLAGLHSYGSN
ncbi:MAG: cytochrome c-type biogenesis protein CcsB [Candidatus Electronema aureum]|uniref:Cytochrome c-type biogenesis protein CcsB n=1 Tax=Candidatus Electronema aureum TaxID=2005002 RepID=A0A521FZJ0_9BACT|nr:MAG: cytochrome c-type biogenesis protein CcsB [Candidatus Electronema aureum]